MASTKVTFDDKVSTITSPLPEINRITGANVNEIKQAINDNADMLDDVAAAVGVISPSIDVTNGSATLAISGSAQASGSITLTNSGYFPSGLGGIKCSSENLRLMEVYISNAASGTCTVSYKYKNTITTGGSPTVTVYVSWTKIN